jgi:hypothetical protein
MDKVPATPFWLSEPTILFNKKHITDIWPDSNMTNMEKLNAISRFVILASLLGYLITLNIGLIFVCIITLGVIAILYHVQSNKNKGDEKMKEKEKEKEKGKEKVKENFTNSILYNEVKDDYTNPKQNNPMMNVLVPEIVYNPTRNEAAPAFNTEVEKKINNNTKNYVVETTFSDESAKQKEYIKRKLFSDLGDSYMFDHSMRNFYTNPSTTIPNDQAGFANFCFGDMISAKEGNEFALARNIPRLGSTYN